MAAVRVDRTVKEAHDHSQFGMPDLATYQSSYHARHCCARMVKLYRFNLIALTTHDVNSISMRRPAVDANIALMVHFS